MTAGEVIEYVHETRHPSFSDKILYKWLNEIEGIVQLEVFLGDWEERHPGERCTLRQYKMPEDEDAELLVRSPHDRIYPAYLECMIDRTNAEFNNYQASYSIFKGFYEMFQRWYSEKHHPANRTEYNDFRNDYENVRDNHAYSSYRP